MPALYPTSFVPDTGDYRYDSLTALTKWGAAMGAGVTLTYSFHNAASNYGDPASYFGKEPWSNPSAPNEVVKAAIRQALIEWSKVANIAFVEVADTGTTNGVLRFGLSAAIDQEGSAGRAGLPSDHFESAGDVWLSPNVYGGMTFLSPGSYYHHVLIHEVGHAIGLTHPFGTQVEMAAAEDSIRYTSMSYTTEPSWHWISPDTGNMAMLAESTPMIYDIMTAQFLYGANMSTAAGNDTYGFDPDRPSAMSIWDAGGTDTIDASRFANAVTINLMPGAFSSISAPYPTGPLTSSTGQTYSRPLDNVSIAFGAVIENAVSGGGNDVLTGNGASNHLVGNGGNDQILGSDGNDYLVGGSGDDHLDGGDGFDIAMFGDSPAPVTVNLSAGVATSLWGGQDTLISIEGAAGTQGHDLFIGTGSDNQFFGYAGNDKVIYNGGNDWFDGGDGFDTVTGFGLRREYTNLSFAGGSGTVGGQAAGAVERYEFADGYFVTGVNDTAAQVYRLYGATLDRAPDSGGLRSWSNAISAGTLTLSTAVDGFTSSTEFQMKYGAVDNHRFATLLYNNVLDRDPDAGGLAGWVGALNGGMTRSQVVLGFSESAENINRTSSDIQKGLWIGDDRAAMITRLYDTVLDRQPDAPGLKGWIGAFNGGMTLKTMADGFTGSAEFQMKYGSLDDVGFVRQLYRNVLDREGEESGVQAWHGGLRGGLSRSDIVIGFSESQEHQNKMAPYIDDGVWFV